MRMKMIESLVYPGALFYWKEEAESAWAGRENATLKAFGSLMGSLRMV